jgi:hypothetical protein
MRGNTRELWRLFGGYLRVFAGFLPGISHNLGHSRSRIAGNCGKLRVRNAGIPGCGISAQHPYYNPVYAVSANFAKLN